MSLTEASSQQGLAPEQVYEIQTMAEGGQFADALIRLRKIKAQYPQATFFVALEKQLERLLILPRDTEPTEVQKRELLESLPGLIQGAVQAMRSGPPTRPMPPPAPPRQAPERVDREAARSQLKEQYFQHADEYLKKGAYGSALVEIRRVKILAPDDKTALEYERTIRQLVELQQRAGIPATPEETPVNTPPVAEHVRKQTDVPVEPHPVEQVASEEPPAPARRSHKGWLLATLLTFLLAGTGLATIFVPETGQTTAAREEQLQSDETATREQNTPVESPREMQAQAPGADVQETPLSESAGQVQKPAPVVPEPTPVAGEVQQQTVPPVADVTPVSEKSVPAEAVKSESDPQIVELVQPAFTPEMLALPGGEVVIMVQIDTEGKPVRTMVAKSTNAAFNQPIVTAVMRSTFKPGTASSSPALKWLTIPFRIN